ncbi:lytic transglycosylase domain-containing protein [Mangrovactinospora gilvigrisea]|nr:lytic transglycosylase domain-containing protein [Mangrovactinospora gilvigrisea]
MAASRKAIVVGLTATLLTGGVSATAVALGSQSGGPASAALNVDSTADRIATATAAQQSAAAHKAAAHKQAQQEKAAQDAAAKKKADARSKAEASRKAAEQKKRQAASNAAAAKARQAAAAKATAAADASSSSSDAAAYSGMSPQAIAQKIVPAGQWDAFNAIITKESGWDVSATNPSTGAYGLAQALPGSKMASAGSDWKTNPATQIKWALTYMNERYGSPQAAWTHEQSNGWY